MPCMDAGPVEATVSKAALTRTQKRLNEVTQSLCYLCASLMNDGILKKYANPVILEWHKEHLAADIGRVKGQLRTKFKKNESTLTSPVAVALSMINTAKAVHPVSSYHVDWFKQMAKEVAKEIIAENKKVEDAKAKKKKALSKLSPADRKLLKV